MLTMFIFLIQLYCALLVKWYNEAMVRLNRKSDSCLGHHISVKLKFLYLSFLHYKIFEIYSNINWEVNNERFKFNS